MKKSGLIWVSGYTSAGKSTVARKVRDVLTSKGVPTILLDGDNLRAILGGGFGYEPDERRRLAKSYMRLSSALCAQGYVVVLAAIAMYDEAGAWMERFIPRHLQVFLNVPEDIRADRDRRIHKNVFAALEHDGAKYDPPRCGALQLENPDGADIGALADQIVTAYLAQPNANVDLGRGQHWDSFYRGPGLPIEPSPFAQTVVKAIQPNSLIVEIGCGNGRDAFFFADQGLSVLAVDPSSAAIEDCIRRKALDFNDDQLNFVCGDAGIALELIGGAADHVYSRFTLHAMPLEEEIEALRNVAEMLKRGGRLHVECRSINDPLARVGDVISETERVQGHYRRFIVKDELISRVVSVGLVIESCEESDGWAKTPTENPVVIRLEAAKP